MFPRTIRILFSFIFSLWIFISTFNANGFAESQSGEDMSYQGAILLLASPTIPSATTAFTMSGFLPPEESFKLCLSTPVVAAYGAGMMLAGISYIPIEAIKKHSELQKKDIMQAPVKPGQPSANLQIQKQGKTEKIEIPLEVNPNPIQLNQKLEDPLDSIPSEVTVDFTPSQIKIAPKRAQ